MSNTDAADNCQRSVQNSEMLNCNELMIGGGIEIPMINMMFESYEDVCNFYDDYARATGFVTMKLRRNLQDGKLRSFTLACCKSGQPPRKAPNDFMKKPSIKTGCLARINANLTKDGLFCLTVVVLDHNHDISPAYASMHPSNKKLDTPIKRQLMLNDKVGIKISKTYSSLAIQAGGFDNVPFGEKECRNFVSKQRSLHLREGDAEAMLNYFRKMQIRNSDFFHVMEVDEEHRMKNVFWADARCRASYESFSDVVTFDTTYLTNKYDMPFAPFVGVNHHGQSILLGCALIANETIDTYVWLFNTWLECMSGIAPKAIITDQCKAIQNAVEKVFPNTHYRLCLWHIMKKIPEKLGRYEKYDDISRIIKRIVHGSLQISEFETDWEKMVEDYGLQDNDWLKNLYEIRYRWVPVYVKDTFWAGMSTTQRSESMNAFFDGYIHSGTTLKQFVEQYEMAMNIKIRNERDEDRKSHNAVYPCISGCDIEKQFQTVYTNKIFKLFQEEIKHLMYCTSVTVIQKCDSTSTFHVTDNTKRFYEGINFKDQVLYEVSLDMQNFKVRCICRLFEFRGILCKHILSVLMHQKVDKVPDTYILLRWRKDIKRGHSDIKIFLDEFESKEENIRYNNLYSRSTRLARSGAKSEKMYMNVMAYFDEVEKKLLKDDSDITQTKDLQAQGNESNQNCDVGQSQSAQLDHKILSPLKVPRKGRPRFKRKESMIEKITKTKKRKVAPKSQVLNMPDMPTGKKKKMTKDAYVQHEKPIAENISSGELITSSGEFVTSNHAANIETSISPVIDI